MTQTITPIPNAPSGGVSVVMVSYFTGPSLFESLNHALSDADVSEVILVDNGNDQQTRNRLYYLAMAEPTLRLISGHGNIGFARGCNLGASTARGKHILILNPDAILEAGAVRALVETLAPLMSPALVGARLLYPNGREQKGARRGEVTPFTTFVAMARLEPLMPRRFSRYRIHHERDPVPDGPVLMPTVSGACFLIRKADFEMLGGFDGGFFLHVEDIDICARARAMGGQVAFDPRARVIHYGSTSGVSSLFIEWHKGWGFVRYFFKHSRTPVGRALIVLFAPLIVGLSLARPLLRPVVRALGLSGKRPGL